MKWIKCTERLPADDEYRVYFVLKGVKEIHKGYYDSVYDTFESKTLKSLVKCVFASEVDKWKCRK